MSRLGFAGAAALALGATAVPASATITIGSPCVSVLEADGGCVFNGNDGPASADAVTESVYNASGKAGAPITLSRIVKYDASGSDFGTTVTLPGFGTISFAADGKSGSWNLPGFTVDFVSVKGGTQFKLTKLTTAGSSGTWDTTGLVGGQGNQPALSHIIFYGGGGVVPEPATWAMLITGFGLVGGALRRRRATVLHVNA